MGIENANDLDPTVGKRDFYLEIDSMDLHPVDIKAMNDVIKLYADATTSPEIIAGDIPCTTADCGIALHIWLDQGRLIAKFVDEGSAGFDSGERIYHDKDDSGDVSLGDIRLLNFDSILLLDNDSTVDSTGSSDFGDLLTDPGNVPSDALEHKDEIVVWRDRDSRFNDDYNMIKLVNVGDTDITTSQLGLTASTSQPLAVNALRVVNVATGEYTLTISGQTLTTPFDVETNPDDKTVGSFFTRVNIFFDNIPSGAIASPVTRGNSESTAAFGLCKITSGVKIACIDNSATELLYLKNSIKIPIYQKLTSGGRQMQFQMIFQAQEKLTDFPIGTITVPFTINKPGEIPRGCDSSSMAGDFCTPPITFGEWPKVNSKLKNDAYSQVYRYAEWVHSFGGPSGEAELRGNDFVEALGEGFDLNWVGHPGGSRHQQSATTAHEMIHLLGGLHGGPEFLIYDVFKEPLNDAAKNCKPFPGVDKYSNQLPNTYLTATLVESGNLQSDIAAGSEWLLAYSDGSHGINPLENDAFDFGPDGPAHVTDMIDNRGGAIQGLDEGFLLEDLPSGLPGTTYTMNWATPTGNIQQLSNTADVDWDGSGTITTGPTTVSADINNYGFPGCTTLEGDTADPIFYDYDTFYHMDFKFLEASGGTFDGVTNFNVDVTDKGIYIAILNSAKYDGHEEVGLTQFLENGEGISIAGITIPIEIALLNDNDDPITSVSSIAQVYVSRTLAASNPAPGSDVDTEWVLLSDNNPSTFGDTTMRFDQVTKSLILDWKTPAEETDFPVTSDVEGIWYGRIVFSDDPIVLDQITICDITSDEYAVVNDKVCLAGEFDKPLSAFLIDSDCPGDGPGSECLPGAFGDTSGERAQATFKVTLEQPKTIKETTYIDLLNDLKGPPNPNDKDTKRDLRKATDHITASIDGALWVDELKLISGTVSAVDLRSGTTVFSEEKTAATNLMDILGLPTSGKSTNPVNDETPEFLAKVREVLLLFEIVDRIIAENHIEDATDLSGPNADCVVLAINEMNEGQVDAVEERFDDAIKHRQAAWEFANNELNAITCTGAPPSVPSDTDGDGISDADEISGALNPFGPNDPTDPLNPDSDGDGLSDGFEIQNGTNPNDSNDPPPPPPPTEQVEVDALIALLGQLAKDKELNKGLSNLLTGEAQAAKIDFINGDVPAGCQKINNIEDEVFLATDNKASITAKTALLESALTSNESTKNVLTAKGCADDPDGFGPGVSGGNKIGGNGNN